MAANNRDKDAKEFITSRLTQNQLQQLEFSDNNLHSLPGECGGKWSVPPPPPPKLGLQSQVRLAHLHSTGD